MSFLDNHAVGLSRSEKLELSNHPPEPSAAMPGYFNTDPTGQDMKQGDVFPVMFV